MREEILEFYRTDGKKIAAKAYIPEGQGKFPTVIFSHGFGGNYRGLEHHGHGFAEAGITCLFFDFCGGGCDSLSDGKMTEMTPLTEIEDLTLVLNKAAGLEYVDENNVFLQGESMGGLVSAMVAAHNPDRIRGLILWYPAFVIPDDSCRRLANGENNVFNMQISPDYNKTAVSLNLWDEIVKYTGNVQIIHGDADLIVPIIYSEKANHIYQNSQMTVIPNAGHGFNGPDSVMARNISADFIKKNVIRTAEEFLTIHVDCKDSHEVKSGNKTVCQIIFEGNAKSKYFNGKVLAGGVDTQVITGESGTLSARYILEGKDYTGTPCKIYISNEGRLGDKYTKPTIITDSSSLAWIMDAQLLGEIDNSEGLVIKISVQ